MRGREAHAELFEVDMSSLLKLLGLGQKEKEKEKGVGDTDTVRRIARELESLEPERARFVAAFAYVLGRVAYADRDISDDETIVMTHLVTELGHLPEEQAALVVEIAKNQNKLFGGTENFLVTREFREIATREQREELLHCLFAVAAADDSITSDEEAQIRQIASELGFDQREFVNVRSAYNDKREVVKMMKKRELG
ncbi:TerB family tellurite resistance protein [Myxococcota bacterium]